MPLVGPRGKNNEAKGKAALWLFFFIRKSSPRRSYFVPGTTGDARYLSFYLGDKNDTFFTTLIDAVLVTRFIYFL